MNKSFVLGIVCTLSVATLAGGAYYVGKSNSNPQSSALVASEASHAEVVEENHNTPADEIKGLGGETKKLAAIPLSKGLSYAQAKKLLLKSGWHTPNLPIGGYQEGDEKLAECMSVTLCNAYPEIDSCSGSGAGYCNMVFYNDAGQTLQITTIGGIDIPPSRNTTVESWEVLGKKTKQADHNCPSLDPKTFFYAYAKDTNVQKQYTSFPLKNSWITEDPESEPQKGSSLLTQTTTNFPLVEGDSLSDYDAETHTGVKWRVQKTAFAAQIFSNYGETTEEFNFEKKQGCWFLTHLHTTSTN